ncbi:MAG: hypothetical protein HZB16_02900 [Armatimonadetes bacterium]|nr:hypothetical protein [Armatimonadota bacterium]
MDWRWLAAALMVLSAARAEEAWHADLLAANAWQPQPGWQANPSAAATAQGAADGLTFRVPEPGRAMKWVYSGAELLDLELFPYLVFTYTATGVSPTTDYLLWAAGDGGGDGVRLLRGADIVADGRAHTLAFNLADLGLREPITRLALGMSADPARAASVRVAGLAQLEAPPAGAERRPADAGPGQSWPLALAPVDGWAMQPGWLANPDDAARIEAAGDRLRLSVPTAARGGKWRHLLPQPITRARFVALRYRASGIAAGGDYALHVSSSGSGKALDEQDAITRGALVCDGGWHTAIAPVTVADIRMVALQVQAAQPGAWLEVASIAFSERRPKPTGVEGIEPSDGWEAATVKATSLPISPMAGTPTKRQTACGVPFTVALNPPGTGVRALGDIDQPVSGSGRTLYLLMNTHLAESEEPSLRSAGSGVVRQVERFVARIEYADGLADEQMPWSVTAQRYQVGQGLSVGALDLDPARQLKRLVLRDRYPRGSFALLGASLSAQAVPGQPAPVPPVLVPAVKPAAAPRPSFRRTGTRVVIGSGSLELTLETVPGLTVVGGRLPLTPKVPLQLAPGPLFRIAVGAAEPVGSEGFVTRRIEQPRDSLRLELVHERTVVRLVFDMRTPDAVGVSAEVDAPEPARLVLPELSGIGFGGETWYWMPRRGAVVNHSPISLEEAYSGAMPMQIIGAFDPAAAAGLFVQTDDRSGAKRRYQVAKDGAGVRLGVAWEGVRGSVPRTLIGGHSGDWHVPFARYRAWAERWNKPAAPRKAWFRQVFSFRQQFMHFALPEPSGMFDAATKQLHLAEVLAADAKAFGGCDYLHLFDWGWDPKRGRCGDYLPWDLLGGAAPFAQQVKAVQDAGTPVGLYIEGILVDPESQLGAQHGKEWQLLGPEGKPYGFFAPSFNMCPHVPAWQDTLAATYGRVAKETGARGFYVDEYGFAGADHACYSPAHNHPAGAWPTLGEQAMLTKIRAAVGPDAALYTEESPVDINNALQDGSFTYAISSVNDEWSPTHLNLYRFAFPTFKTFEIIVCDQPLGSNLEAVRRIAFNGEGIWLEGIASRWFSPETRAEIARYHAVLRREAACFAGDWPTPLVPTLSGEVYANRFDDRAGGGGVSCWTVYNTAYRTARGTLLAVEHRAGVVYRDELTGQEIKPTVRGAQDLLSLELGPRAVTIVSRKPRG